MAPPSPRSTFAMIMEPGGQDQNQQLEQGERQAAASTVSMIMAPGHDQNQEEAAGRQEESTLPMIMASQDDQNLQDGGVQEAQQQQNINDAELQLIRQEEARQILQQVGRASGSDSSSHALRVYRGNWRGAQERSVLRKMIEDLRMKDALDRLNESPDVNVRMQVQQQQYPYQAPIPNYMIPINPLMRAPLAAPPHQLYNNRLLPHVPVIPAAFMPAYAMNHPDETGSYPFVAETMEGNNSSTTTGLMTKDLLSNFGKNNNSNYETDAVLTPVEEDNYSITTLAGGSYCEHGESSAGAGTETRKLIDFFAIENRKGGQDDHNKGVDLNLGL